MIQKLSDGDPTVLAIGLYGEPQFGFDSVLGTKLIDELKKFVGVYHAHPLETDYEDMPEVDFTISLGPPARSRMLGEDFQQYDRGTSFAQTMMDRTEIARIILQEWPWQIPPGPMRSLKSIVLNFSVGPISKVEPWPSYWGEGWFFYRGVYWLYPFVDKQENYPARQKRDFVVLDCPDPHGTNWDFSDRAVKVLDELGVEYFQGARDFKDRIPHRDFAEKINQAKIYFQVKAESYSMTAIEAVASQAFVIGTHPTLRRLYKDEFGFVMMPDDNLVTLRKAVTEGLKAYDDTETKSRLRRMRAKLWSYRKLAWEISDALKKIKYGD